MLIDEEKRQEKKKENEKVNITPTRHRKLHHATKRGGMTKMADVALGAQV